MTDPQEGVDAGPVWPDPDLLVAGGATLSPARVLYPPVTPRAGGLLDVGQGQQIYWEECGNPRGKPAVFLHGGPGGGGGTDRRRFFNPDAYRLIVFDQRGCGASTPHAATDADLSANTTWHLVRDIERLREARGISKWLVFGGSWGSTLALAYAQTHPERVSELVLRGIYTLRRRELDWYYNYGVSELFPEWWQVFCAPLERAGHDFATDNMAGYHRLLFDPDPRVHLPAAIAWTSWEAATSTLLHDQGHVQAMAEPGHALAFARIENHYFVNGGWLREGQLLDQAHTLAGIPTTIVQGRYDMPCAPSTAQELHRRLPGSVLKMVLAGHSAFEPHIASELVAATDRYADLDQTHVPPAAPPPSGMDEAARRGMLDHLRGVRFATTTAPGVGYQTGAVDAFIDDIEGVVGSGEDPERLLAQARFPFATGNVEGYVAEEVDAFIDALLAAGHGGGFAGPHRVPPHNPISRLFGRRRPDGYHGPEADRS